MFTRLKSLLLPSHDDEDNPQAAITLTIILWAIILIVGSFLIVWLITQPAARISVTTFANAAIVLLAVFLLFLKHAGRVKLASIILVSFVWIDLTVQGFANDGVRGSAFIAYTATVVLASLLLSWQIGVGFAILSIAMLWLLAHAEAIGAITPGHDGPYQVALETTVIFVITTILLVLIMSGLQRALKRNAASRKALSETNLKLQSEIEERAGIEAHLLASEARYRMLFEQANDALFIERIDTDEIVDVNRRASELLGYSREELLTMTVPDLQAPEFRGQAGSVLKTIFTRYAESPFESVNIHRDGRRIPVEITTSKITEIDDNLAFCVIRNITERKRNEALTEVRLRLFEFATQHSLEALLQKTLDEVCALTNSSVGFYHFVEADQKTLSLQAWSTRTLTEFCKAEGRGLHYDIDQAGIWVDCVRERRPVIHNDYASLPHRKGLPEGHAPVIRELVIPIFRDDQVVAILGVGNKPQNYDESDIDTIAYIADIAWEITAHKRAEEALQESELRLRAMFEQAAVGVTQSNIATGQFVNVNQKFCDILGYTREEMLQKTFLEITHPEDRKPNLTHLQPLLEGRVRAYTQDKRYIHKNGSTVWCHLTVSVLGFPDDRRAFIGILEDITERKRIEAEREQLIAELETKNAELERFTYTVSHDLKSPLITIGGFLGFIERDARTGKMERMYEDLDRVRGATRTMQQLLDELLELSRIGRIMNPPQEVPFEIIVQEAVELVSGQLTERGVDVVIMPGLPTVIGDRARLTEIVQNLVDNAAKFMGEQPAPRIEIGMRRQNNERVFYVQDNGIGIAPSYHHKVFDLFEKLDADSDGTGIGLALVKRIIEVHGGHVWVESEGKGLGSTFYFTLPDGSEQQLRAS